MLQGHWDSHNTFPLKDAGMGIRGGFCFFPAWSSLPAASVWGWAWPKPQPSRPGGGPPTVSPRRRANQRWGSRPPQASPPPCAPRPRLMAEGEVAKWAKPWPRMCLLQVSVSLCRAARTCPWEETLPVVGQQAAVRTPSGQRKAGRTGAGWAPCVWLMNAFAENS